jgi:hypothetical protein
VKAVDYIEASRVPESLKPQTFGLWTIRRFSVNDHPAGVRLADAFLIGFKSYTLLHHWTMATLHTHYGEIVMEDSVRELRKHLPIWMNAKGRVLITGLGLGCVVRGLLANREVDKITVVEIDPQIIRVIGREFRNNKRVEIVQADAFKISFPEKFDYAWHDIWDEGPRHISTLHSKLLIRFSGQCAVQGAWGMPRWFTHRMKKKYLR